MTFVIFKLSAITALVVAWVIYKWCKEKADSIDVPVPSEPFSVAEYFGRIEQAQLDILQDQDPVDQTVILWWGLDGLTLDENGELKWISRKKKAPTAPVYPSYISFQQNMCNATFPVYPFGCAQTATIRDLQMQNAALQMQAWQQTQTSNMLAQMQNCCSRPIWM